MSLFKRLKKTAHARTFYGGRINGETKKFARINKHAAHKKVVPNADAPTHAFQLKSGSVSKCRICGRSRSYGNHSR